MAAHYHSITSRAAMTLGALLLCLTALAGSAPEGGFTLPWFTIDGGGVFGAVGGPYELSGSIGQPDASEGPMAGGDFSISGGFWPGGPTPQPQCPPDIAPPPSGDGLVNVNDLLLVIGNWGAVGANVADVNGDNVVNVNDLLAVIGAWGVCP